jgi:bacillithiol system protein YtxJ
MGRDLNELSTIEALDHALSESNERPVLLFKHSLTCPISSRAFREFQSYLERGDAAVSYALIKVQNSRPVSNEAASRLGVRHETPQAILIRNGREVWNASHFDITADALEEAIARAS